MKKLIDYMKKMFQKVEQEPTKPLLRQQPLIQPTLPSPSRILPMAKKVISPSDVYEEDVSDRIGHINFNKIRRFKETGGQITHDFYNDAELID